MSLSLSNNGFEFLKAQEGCILTAYKNAGEQYWTIGYGHYGADVYEGMTITQAQADALFRTDVKVFEGYVNNYAVSKFESLNQNQFDALVSYCYNRGPGGLQQLVNNSDSIAELATNIVVYWGSNTNYQDALIARRKREQALFNTAVDSGGGSGGDDSGGSEPSEPITTKKRKGFNFVLFGSNKRKRVF